MKNRLLFPSVAGVGFLAGLGIAAVRGDLWWPRAAPGQELASHVGLQPAAVSVQAMGVQPVTPTPEVEAAAQPQPAASEPTAADLAPGREGADSAPAPTYEEQAAARDRAAAHSARSR
jgi:hypothetical protein